ncbi:MAG: NADH-quinone oxidoreductase subunit J [Candidatus Sericytochromatia bacterium]|nr:NADH-quinone oxidoreductase subunit J [Candidatus Sericytochromatia bacterium]
MHPLFFYLLSALAIVAALAMITQRQPLTAAFLLVVSFLGLAGLYAMLMAPLLAILQVLVYAGAIMALVVFVIMLLNVREADLPHEPHLAWHLGGALAVSAVLFSLLNSVIARFVTLPAPPAQLVARYGAHASGEPRFGGIDAVGLELFTRYTFPFEVISILLTVAVVGVVVLAKRRI